MSGKSLPYGRAVWISGEKSPSQRNPGRECKRRSMDGLFDASVSRVP